MVVPYVKPIEKPSDSRVIDLDNEMSAVISNPKLSIADKVRQYTQALARFQTHFDPETHGESATMLNMAGAIKSMAEETMLAREDMAEKAKSDKDQLSAIVTAIQTPPAPAAAPKKAKKAQVAKVVEKPAEETDVEDAFASPNSSPIRKPAIRPQPGISPSNILPAKRSIIKPAVFVAGAKSQTGQGLWLTKKFF